MKYVGSIRVDYHNILVAEFIRLMPVMDRSRIVTKTNGKRYYEGCIEIVNDKGIELDIGLFSVVIGD